MKRSTCALLMALAMALLSIPTHAQTVTLAHLWDMDGVAADPDFVMLASVIVSGKADYAISGGTLDQCRLVDITVVDTDLGVGEGALTVVGTDCLGFAKSCSWSAWTAADDSGAKTLTCTDGRGAYYKTVTAATAGTFTAAATDETFAVGFTSNSAEAWPMCGAIYTSASGAHGVNPLSHTLGTVPITTGGALSTTVTGTNAFTSVLAGDVLSIHYDGETLVRKVVARGSASSITVDSSVSIPAAGPPSWSYQHCYVSSNPADRLWIMPGEVAPGRSQVASSASYQVQVAANVNTGGVISRLQCTQSPGADSWTPVGDIAAGTVTTASGAADTTYVAPVSLASGAYRACRLSFRFGTGDDVDTAAESISATVSVR